MNPENDSRTVLSLDAGGTNFVFSAIKANKQLIEPIHLPSEAHNLDKCLANIIKGFEMLKSGINENPVAISFAFPGPADYEHGIIGNLPNFDAFNGDVPLGPLLEEKFKMPVFINNDGNLFAYGEALSGYLPALNKKISKKGGIKKYKNLIGLTLGTGFGGGIVLNNTMIVGDSSCGAEVHNTLNKFNVDWNAEESVSTRAIKRVYAAESGLLFTDKIMPEQIANIAKGLETGNKEAAIKSFEIFGEALGSSITNILTMIDGVVVLGGGITAAWDLFAPQMFKEINRNYVHISGYENDRLSFKVYNLEDETTFDEFAKGDIKKIKSFEGTEFEFDTLARTGVGKSKIGASTAIWLGAYSFALQQLT